MTDHDSAPSSIAIEMLPGLTRLPINAVRAGSKKAEAILCRMIRAKSHARSKGTYGVRRMAAVMHIEKLLAMIRIFFLENLSAATPARGPAKNTGTSLHIITTPVMASLLLSSSRSSEKIASMFTQSPTRLIERPMNRLRKFAFDFSRPR